MRTLYLYTDGTMQVFLYNNLSELSHELTKRGISIRSGALIGNRVSIENDVSIGYDVSIGRGTLIGYGALIGSRVSIGNVALIGNRVSIGNDVSIGSGAFIGNDVSILKTLSINGSKHHVNWYGTGIIHIGCRCLTIAEWQELYAEIGANENYTDAQIKEYKTYIDICAQLQSTIQP